MERERHISRRFIPNQGSERLDNRRGKAERITP